METKAQKGSVTWPGHKASPGQLGFKCRPSGSRGQAPYSPMLSETSASRKNLHEQKGKKN